MLNWDKHQASLYTALMNNLSHQDDGQANIARERIAGNRIRHCGI